MRSWISLYIDYLDVMFRPFYYYPPAFPDCTFKNPPALLKNKTKKKKKKKKVKIGQRKGVNLHEYFALVFF